MNQPVTVIAVMGLSFCGSTLLNLMLDSHPAIYGGGELHALNRKDGSVSTCSICSGACPYWTLEHQNAVSEHNFYLNIGNLFGSRIIVDSSKEPIWFQEHRKFSSDVEIRWIPVVLVKHPIRHITSFLINHGHVAYEQHPDLLNRLYNDVEFRKKQVQSIMNHVFIKGYNNIFLSTSKIFGDNSFLLMKYENIIEHTESELGKLLSLLGLDYGPCFEHCYEYEHHPIGGNSACTFQYHGSEEAITQLGPVRERFYRKLKGMSVDDKYKSMLTPGEIAWLNEDKHVRYLYESFGYEPLI